MILTCPQCATSYFVPDEAVGGAGRRVRCQSCAHTWRAMADEPLELVSVTRTITVSEAPPADPAPATFGKREDGETLAETPAPELPRAYRARAEQQRRLRRAATHGVVWAGLASIFVGIMAAGWLFRVEVVDLYPRAAAAYAFVGSPVNPTGLEFEAVTARAVPDLPGMVLISGAVRNVREQEIVTPPIRVALLDAQGHEIGHQIVRINAAPVLPGKVQGFAILAPDPKAEAADIETTFAPVIRQPPLQTAEAPRTVLAARPVAPAHGLRPAVEVGHTAGPALEPVDAQPIEATPTEAHASTGQAVHGPAPAVAPTAALDKAHSEAVSAPHNG